MSKVTKTFGTFLIVAVVVAAVVACLVWLADFRTVEIIKSAPVTATVPVSVSATTTIVITGDIMLDRNVRNVIDVKGFDAFFAGVHDLVSDADVAVGNLEGPFTMNPSKTSSFVSKELTFTFDPKLAPKLAELGFDVLGLANNHTLNFGQAGLDSTRTYIRAAGMQYYGDPNNADQISTIVVRNGVRIGFVGFHEFSYVGFDNVLAEIDRLRPLVDVLIVSPHWGVEYQTEPTTLMQKYARLFIDHGADAVVGAHPHVAGEIEEYMGKPIFYSLGNFAFDQYFSEETMKGMAVRLLVGKEGVRRYEMIPVEVGKNGVTIGI
jgi:gamma-polyglutamate biosynthesis protein CapA